MREKENLPTKRSKSNAPGFYTIHTETKTSNAQTKPTFYTPRTRAARPWAPLALMYCETPPTTNLRSELPVLRVRAHFRRLGQQDPLAVGVHAERRLLLVVVRLSAAVEVGDIVSGRSFHRLRRVKGGRGEGGEVC